MASSLSAESGASAGSVDAEVADAGEGVCVRSTSCFSLTAPSRQHDAAGSIPWDGPGDKARRRLEMFDLIVIGGGPAGATAALRARELGASVALVERNSRARSAAVRSEEHTSELQSRLHLVCRLLLEKKKKKNTSPER